MSFRHRSDRSARGGYLRAAPGVIASLAILSVAGYGERSLRAHAERASVASAETVTVTHVRGAVATAAPRARLQRTATAAFTGLCHETHAFCLSDAMCSTGACELGTDASRALSALDAHPTDDSLPLMPSLAWNGSGYGVAWMSVAEEDSDLYFARLDAAGKRIGAIVKVTPGRGLKLLPRLAWNGSGYGLVYTYLDESGERAEVMLARLGADGALQGAATRLSRQGSVEFAGDLVWTGAGYGVSWVSLESDYQMTLRFGRYNVGGEVQGAVRAVHNNFVSTGFPSVSWTGDGYGIGLNTFLPRDEKSATLLVRIPGSGEGGSVDRVAQGEGLAGAVSVAWNGGQQGMAWEDDLDFEDDEDPSSALMFAAVGSGGNVPRRAITQRNRLSLMPSLSWSGAGYGLAWTDVGDGTLRVLFHRLGRDGAPAGSPLAVNTSLAALMPSLRWNGQEYAAAWTDVGRSAIDICLGRISAAGQRVGSASCIGAR